MNRGTLKQRELEAEFVSSTQSKHFERVHAALAITLETDISKDALEIERFGGCENICHILRTEHPALSYGRLLTFGTLAKVLYSKFEDGMNDMLIEMNGDINENTNEEGKKEKSLEHHQDDNKDKTENSYDYVENLKQCVKKYYNVEILCIRRVVSAILYLLTDFVEELKRLEAEGWAQNEEPGKTHPLLQAIDDNKYELLSLIHKTQERMIGKEDAFEINKKYSKTQEESESSESLLEMIERPTIQCINDCSRIISILSQNDKEETKNQTKSTKNDNKKDIETHMQQLGSMQLHSDLLGNITAVRSRVDNVVKSSLVEKEAHFVLFQQSETDYDLASTSYEKAAEAAKRGLKSLKEMAKQKRKEFTAAAATLKRNTYEYEKSLRKYNRSKGVELTLQIILTSTVEAIGYLGNTLEPAKNIAVSTFVVDELASFADKLVDDDRTTIAVCNAIEKLAFESDRVKHVVYHTDGLAILLKLFNDRSPKVKAAAALALATMVWCNCVKYLRSTNYVFKFERF